MVTVRDVPADLFIRRLAERLKKDYGEIISPPYWANFVKTGVHKEKPPQTNDWWYARAASILRKLYLAEEPLGIETLRTIYGGLKRRGVAPPHFRKGSGAIIRNVLKQLEKAGLVRKIARRGRVLSSKGRSYLDEIAFEVFRELNKERPELIKYYQK
ncbi:MAG: 30S ribosomal protein S19e [Sulfolobales archaeon]